MKLQSRKFHQLRKRDSGEGISTYGITMPFSKKKSPKILLKPTKFTRELWLWSLTKSLLSLNYGSTMLISIFVVPISIRPERSLEMQLVAAQGKRCSKPTSKCKNNFANSIESEPSTKNTSRNSLNHLIHGSPSPTLRRLCSNSRELGTFSRSDTR